MAFPTKEAILKEARRVLGESEHPNGSNKTIFGKWFGWNGVAWCAIFICWLFLRLGAVFNKNASAWDLADKLAKKTGWKLIKPADATSGDIASFIFSHIGLIESRRDKNTVITIEGNHNNKVSRVVRSNQSLRFAVRPPYTRLPKAPKPVPNNPTNKQRYAKVQRDATLVNAQVWNATTKKWVTATRKIKAGRGGTVIVEHYADGMARIHWGRWRGKIPGDHLGTPYYK